MKKNGKIKKVGHVGTLDPMATGILILGLNEATKLIPYLEGQAKASSTKRQKTYEFDICFGQSTDTLDALGNKTSQKGDIPSETAIHEACAHFIGSCSQTPPAFSAVKKNGKKAYDLARKGLDVELEPRQVEIFSLNALGFQAPGIARFIAVVSAGTYIRALARDLAAFVKSCGFVLYLRRLNDGLFSVKNALSFEKIRQFVYKEEWGGVLLPLESLLGDIPDLSLGEGHVASVLHGQPFPIYGVLTGMASDGQVVRMSYLGTLVGMGRIKGELCWPERILKAL
jgi:tRNA pseudouridine55 synthase